ncbi:phosphotransferase [Enterococcus rivorum]|uniref:Choline kinase n=1 Tax=Enterococcus rivorum TaxID=762845 RepID=A0A1E5KSL0_9ENTE|nr:phosphotransferase [Enterococcus rivorum]MBP2098238.1 thiamine kinase-like enzyme [Enterococcus rivorum]OEH80843.1 choline kinase [Enterococcus rivorum]
MINRKKIHDSLNIDTIIDEKLQEFFNDPTLHFDRSLFTGGLTNYNYLMHIHGHDYVIREPGILTEIMIDRQIEQQNTALISTLNVNSSCVYFDAKTGIKISEFIPNSKNLAQADPFIPKNLKAVTDILKKVHTSEVPFLNVFDLKHELNKYEEVIKSINGALFFDYHTLKEKVYHFFDEYVKNVQLVPCHNDTVPENFLVDDKTNYFLIDWEYSGLNDATFDLAAFIVETRLSKEAIQQLLKNYYGNTIPVDAIQKIKAYILAQDLLWTVWALIRHYSGDNFLDYCDMRYERCRKNILALSKDPEYPLYQMVAND